MNKRIRYIVDAGAVLSLVGLVWGAVWFSLKKEAVPERVKKIEKLKKGDLDFPFYDLQNKPHLFSDFYDDVVLVNIWATWCAPCIEELPSMVRLVQRIKGDFTLIAVSDEPPEVIRSFLDRLQIKPPARFIVATSNEVYGIFKPQALPESFLFQKGGKLVQKIIGPRVWDSFDWQTDIQDLIEQTP